MKKSFIEKIFRELIIKDYSSIGLDRNNIFNHCMEFVKKNQIDGDILEFGCYNGVSTKSLGKAYLRYYKNDSKTFWIYDSFEGLPDLSDNGDKHPNFNPFKQGEYKSNQSIVLNKMLKLGIKNKYIKIVPGFFNEILPNVNEHPKNISIVHIDVDLYSSCLDVLNYLSGKLQDGTLLIFDDYYCYRGNEKYGVPKAIKEWSESNNFTLKEYCNYGWAGKVLIFNI